MTVRPKTITRSVPVEQTYHATTCDICGAEAPPEEPNAKITWSDRTGWYFLAGPVTPDGAEFMENARDLCPTCGGRIAGLIKPLSPPQETP
jgi:hypothetical protein